MKLHSYVIDYESVKTYEFFIDMVTFGLRRRNLLLGKLRNVQFELKLKWLISATYKINPNFVKSQLRG